MQTHFSLAQLADPAIANADKILRACVHCGFCTATCPTYVLLGDELDSPRGRIYLIKEMLESGRAADDRTVKHVDRCLSCLSCMTTCPSGVHYMHLVDHARHHIQATYQRPLMQRMLRRTFGVVLPNPRLFRFALIGAAITRPLARIMPKRWRGLWALAPRRPARPSAMDRPQVFASEGPRLKRVALMTGCAQQALAPSINEATIRLLTRHGCEVVIAKGAGCCGALNHHLGQDSLAMVKANITAWQREIDTEGLDAIIINASGCGTTVKDYGFMLKDDAAFAKQAATIAALTRDISEFMACLGLQKPSQPLSLRVAYHSACSLQHGQSIRIEPKTLLANAGFKVLDVPESHLCCGSAGTYNLLQPDIANGLRDRKVAAIASVTPDCIAAGNIGCITQIASGTQTPVVHTVELLDWATGGPKPQALAGL